jgi:hypothetical protein
MCDERDVLMLSVHIMCVFELYLKKCDLVRIIPCGLLELDFITISTEQ